MCHGKPDRQTDRGSKLENLALPRGLSEAADKLIKNRELLQKARKCLSVVINPILGQRNCFKTRWVYF